MHILILNWRDIKHPKRGGAEIVTLEHAKAWIRKGHKVTWYTARYKNAPREEIIEGIKVVRWGNFFTVYLFAPAFYFFSRSKFDFVIDEFHGLPYFTPLFVNKPKIAFIHEVAEVIWDYMYPFPINKIGKNFEKVFYHLYKGMPVWTDAESTVDDLVRYGLNRRDCAVIHCPINNETLSNIPKKSSKPIFVFCSRVVRMKALDNVIKSFNIISKEIKDARLWVVGGGDEKYIEEMKQLIKSFSLSNKVKFFGHVPNDRKLELMRESHIQLLGMTAHGGWGLVLIEAASQGTPSIVYDVSGLKDAVRDGITGIVLKENSPEEMAKQAIALYNDKKTYRKYQENGLKWSRSITWEKATKQSMDLINSVRSGFKK